jgi:toxin ParE1/3/4
MARIVVSLLAQADAAAIIIDLKNKAGHSVAAKYVESFQALYDRLAVHPDSGAPRPAIGRHVRIGIVSPYVVIYERDRMRDLVTIFRVVHGRRRISGNLLRGT